MRSLARSYQSGEAFGSKRWPAGLTLEHLLPISSEYWLLEYFSGGAWYIFVRIGFCCVFDHSTKELHHGEESKEKESQKEEVILTLGVAS